MISASFSIHRNGNVTAWTPEAEVVFGRRAEEALGTRLPPRLHEQLRPLVELACTGGNPVTGSVRVQRADGLIELHLSGAPIAQPGGCADTVLFLAVVEGDADVRVKHLNRVLWTLRKVNQLAVRATHSGALIRDTCQLLVDMRGYASALLVLEDARGNIIDFAEAGIGEHFVPLADDLRRGVLVPCCLAVRDAFAPALVVDRDKTCTGCSLAEVCPSHDVLCVRLRHGAVPLGYLAVSMDRAFGSSLEEQDLLGELAVDLSLALDALREEELRGRAQERRQQSELEQREAHLAAIYKNAPMIMMLVDEERRVREVNGHGARFAYRSMGEMIGLRGGEALRCLYALESGGCGGGPSCESCVVRRAVEDSIRTGRAHHQQEATLPFLLDGEPTEVTFLVSSTPLQINGQTHVLVCIMDITDRRLAEKARQVERDNLLAILDSAPVSLLMLDPSEQVVKANATAERMFQTRLVNLKSPRCGDFFGCVYRHEDSREGASSPHCGACPLLGAIRRSLRDGDPTRDLELEVVVETAKEPKRMWLAANVQPLMLDGQTHLIVALNDITDRKQAIEALARSEARSHAMYDRLPMPTVVWQREHDDFVLTQFNRAAREISRGGVARQLGTALHELHAHEPAIIDDIQRCYCEESVFQRELSLRYHPTDQQRILRVTYGFVPPDMVMVHTEDLTERRRADERLRLSQRLEAIGQLAGGVAHDFNNLLLVINGNVEFMLEELPENDPNRVDALEILRAGRRAATLTRQLLAFSRRQVLESKILNLNDVLDGSLRMLGRLLGEDIRIDARRAPDLGNVTADPGQIEQIILNLVVNARDAMPEGGVVTIETANVVLDEDAARGQEDVVPGAYVRLSVTDTGLGMDADTLQRAFEPFFTTKEVGKGTGLGLPTVYGIVRQSGGSIWVRSKLGQGATIQIHLPRCDAPAPSSRPTLAPVRAPGEETVLLAEDERAVRETAERILCRAGYRVIAASSGAEALELMADQRVAPDLLLTDVVMPQMSGIQLAENLRVRFPDMKVLYMSGYTDRAVVHHGELEAGVSFISKPFTVSALTRKVREALARQAQSEDSSG